MLKSLECRVAAISLTVSCQGGFLSENGGGGRPMAFSAPVVGSCSQQCPRHLVLMTPLRSSSRPALCSRGCWSSERPQSAPRPAAHK